MRILNIVLDLFIFFLKHAHDGSPGAQKAFNTNNVLGQGIERLANSCTFT